MSTNLEQLIGQAITSPEFRNQLLADPDQAIAAAGVNLSTDELTHLKNSIAQLKASPNSEGLLTQYFGKGTTLLGW